VTNSIRIHLQAGSAFADLSELAKAAELSPEVRFRARPHGCIVVSVMACMHWAAQR
jgi:hypothetical protein